MHSTRNVQISEWIQMYNVMYIQHCLVSIQAMVTVERKRFIPLDKEQFTQHFVEVNKTLLSNCVFHTPHSTIVWLLSNNYLTTYIDIMLLVGRERSLSSTHHTVLLCGFSQITTYIDIMYYYIYIYCVLMSG